MEPYQSLPDAPEQLSPASVLARLTDAIGFRYQVATQGLNDDHLTFRATPESMSMQEVLHHIYNLIFWSYRSIEPEALKTSDLSNLAVCRRATLELCQTLSQKLIRMSDEELDQVTIHLRRTGTDYPFWYLINGPLSDALTHIGQVNSWRRMAGNPVARISPFTGEPF